MKTHEETPLYSDTNVPVIHDPKKDTGHFKYRLLGYNDVSTIGTVKVVYAHRISELQLFHADLRRQYRFVVRQRWNTTEEQYRQIGGE